MMCTEYMFCGNWIAKLYFTVPFLVFIFFLAWGIGLQQKLCTLKDFL